MGYYIIVNQQQIGPLFIEQLRQYDIYPETKVWKDGLQDWVPASQLLELSGMIKSKSSYIVNSGTTTDSNRYQTLLLIIAFYIVFNTLFWTVWNLTKPDFRGVTRYISLLFVTVHNSIPIVVGIFTRNTVLKVLLICLGIVGLAASIYNVTKWW